MNRLLKVLVLVLGLSAGLLLILGLGVTSALPAGASGGSIEDFIDSEMPASGVPGLAYAVVAGNEITETGARGVAKLGGDQSTRQDVAPMRALAAVDDESNEHGTKVSAGRKLDEPRLCRHRFPRA